MSSCKLYMDIESNLYLQNNSNKAIVGWFASLASTYPDTILPKEIPSYRLTNVPAKSKDIVYTMGGGGTYKDWFDDEFPKITIYIFDPDTLKKYSWEEVCEDYKILKRYDLSYEDLKEMDFEVVYP